MVHTCCHKQVCNGDRMRPSLLELSSLRNPWAQEALEFCEQAFRNDYPHHVLKSFILDQLGDRPKALEEWRKIVDPDRYLTEGGDNDQNVTSAFDTDETAQKIPTYFSRYIAENLEKLGRYEEAIKVCNDAIRQNPDDAKMYHTKASCLISLHRLHEALETFSHLERLLPNEGVVFEGQAVLLADLGRYPEGLKACERAISLGSTTRAFSIRTECLHAMGRNTEALSACENAIYQDPDNPMLYLTQGRAFYALECYEEALMAYEHALRLDPHDAETWHHKSEVLEQLGKSKEAKLAYKEAERLGYENLSE